MENRRGFIVGPLKNKFPKFTVQLENYLIMSERRGFDITAQIFNLEYMENSGAKLENFAEIASFRLLGGTLLVTMRIIRTLNPSISTPRTKS